MLLDRELRSCRFCLCATCKGAFKILSSCSIEGDKKGNNMFGHHLSAFHFAIHSMAIFER